MTSKQTFKKLISIVRRHRMELSQIDARLQVFHLWTSTKFDMPWNETGNNHLQSPHLAHWKPVGITACVVCLVLGWSLKLWAKNNVIVFYLRGCGSQGQEKGHENTQTYKQKDHCFANFWELYSLHVVSLSDRLGHFTITCFV